MILRNPRALLHAWATQRKISHHLVPKDPAVSKAETAALPLSPPRQGKPHQKQTRSEAAEGPKPFSPSLSGL